MPNKWLNGGDNVVTDYRPGGPGNDWKLLDPNGSIDATSGGGRSRETQWGRGDLGGLQPRGVVLTGNPEDFTGNLSYPLTNENILLRLDCPFDVRARQYCGNNKGVMTSYASPGILGYRQATITSYTYNNPIAQMDGQGSDVQKQAAFSATLEERYTPVAHDDISQQTSDVDFNRVIAVGARICQGACGIEATEEDAWIAVTDKDASPAYAGGSAPWLYYTTDRWQTRTGVRIGSFLSVDALDVVLCGDRVVVFSDSKAPVYAKLADIYNGVTDPNLWATSTGFSSLSSTNFPKAAVAVDSSTILAVHNGGRISLSTDAGLSFSIIVDTGVLTSQNLNCITAQPSGNAYAGGNSGVFIRLIKSPGSTSYTASLIAVKDASLNTLSSNINSIRTPPGRGDEVYLGTAGGEIWRSRRVNDTKVVFTNMSFDRTGIGSITDMNFAGFLGDLLYVVQTNTDNTSRVLRDWSGGALGKNVEIVGDFTTPSNFKINSIALANVNMGITVGQIHETYAFVGMIRPN